MKTQNKLYKNWNSYTKSNFEKKSKTINTFLMKSLFKKLLITLLCMASWNSFSQEIEKDSLRSQIFSLSPISKRVDTVNGLVLGIGHVANKNIENQTINGLNIEANPAPIAGALMGFLVVVHLPDIIKNKVKTERTPYVIKKIENWSSSPHLKVNGINLSTGCFFVPTTMNGINVSLANKFNDLNGVSVTALGVLCNNQRGLSVGLINANNSLKGITVGLCNQSYDVKGIQVGAINFAHYQRGIQIGIYNRSFSRGLQLGLWNKNSKRSLPIINF